MGYKYQPQPSYEGRPVHNLRWHPGNPPRIKPGVQMDLDKHGRFHLKVHQGISRGPRLICLGNYKLGGGYPSALKTHRTPKSTKGLQGSNRSL